MKIITEQEQKRGFKYKYVITTRSDLKYVLPHPPMALFEESSARNPFSIYSVSTKPYSKEARIFDKHFVLPREAADIFIGGLYNAYLDSSICSIMYLKAFEHIMITWIQIVGLDHFMIPSPFYLTCTPETRTLVSPCRHDAISTAYVSMLILETCTLLESFALHHLACSCILRHSAHTRVIHYRLHHNHHHHPSGVSQGLCSRALGDATQYARAPWLWRQNRRPRRVSTQGRL
jgi:hypothetical protein